MRQGSFLKTGLGLSAWFGKTRRRVVRINSQLEVLERRALLSMVAGESVAAPDAEVVDSGEGVEPVDAEFEMTLELDGFVDEPIEGEWFSEGEEGEWSEFIFWSMPFDESWSGEEVAWEEFSVETTEWEESEFLPEEEWLYLPQGEWTDAEWDGSEVIDPMPCVCYCGISESGEELPCEPLPEEQVWDDLAFWSFGGDGEEWIDDQTNWDDSGEVAEEGEVVGEEGEIIEGEVWTFGDGSDLEPVDGNWEPRWIEPHFRGVVFETGGEVKDGELSDPSELFLQPMMFNRDFDQSESPDDVVVDPIEDEGSWFEGGIVEEDGEIVEGEVEVIDLPEVEFTDDMVWTFGGFETDGGQVMRFEALMSAGPGLFSESTGTGTEAVEPWGAWQLSLLGQKAAVSSNLLDEEESDEIV